MNRNTYLLQLYHSFCWNNRYTIANRHCCARFCTTLTSSSSSSSNNSSSSHDTHASPNQARKVRTRFAPSPTGELHLGGLRTALYSYALAKHHDGEFLIRIEDTDQTRTVAGVEERILQSLQLVGIEHQPKHEPIVKQSLRSAVYRTYADKMVEQSHAYFCFCSKGRLEMLRKRQVAENQPTKYDGLCSHISNEEAKERVKRGEKFTIRMRIPVGSTEVNDKVYGRIVFANDTLDDQVVIKEDGHPTYHLASVVDDFESKITHVVRGDEWLPSTPKHILLNRYLNFPIPTYSHLPLLLTPDGKKLSKRSEIGAPLLSLLQKGGCLPSALVNFVALLGWGDYSAMRQLLERRERTTHVDEKNKELIFNLNEFCEMFTIDKVTKAPGIVDQEKLAWINSMHIRRVVEARDGAEYRHLFARVKSNMEEKFTRTLKREEEEKLHLVVFLLRERVRFLHDFVTLGYHFFVSNDEFVTMMNTDERQKLKVNHFAVLSRVVEDGFEFSEQNLETMFRQYEKKNVLSPLRLALTGGTIGAPVVETVKLMGSREAKERIKKVIS